MGGIKLKNVLEALNVVEEFVRKDKRVYSVDFNIELDRLEVNMCSDDFIELVETLNIQPNSSYSFQLFSLRIPTQLGCNYLCCLIA